MRNVVLALVALSSCSKSPARQDWVNGDRIDTARWGAPCGKPEGSSILPAGEPGVSTRSWRTIGSLDEPNVDCRIGYDNRTGKVFSLSVRTTLVDREHAERLLGDLIIQYLPPDAQLVARDVAFTKDAGLRFRRAGAFQLDGEWETTNTPGKANVDLSVRHGEPPPSRSATGQAAAP